MPEIIVKLGDNIIQKYFFCQDRLTIGRALENDIVIENLAVSRTHAVIEREGDGYFVTDQGSSNGTLINGTRVERAQILNRDIISIGKYQLFFFDTHAAEARRAMPCDQERTMLVPAAQEPLPAELVVTKGRQKGLRFSLASPVVKIGRGSDNTIRLTDWFVSRNHAVIERSGDNYVIRDLDSWRHTSVNGRNVTESVLTSGDVIGLGPSVELGFGVPENAQPLARPRFPHEFMAEPPRREEAPEPQPPSAVEQEYEEAAQAPEFEPRPADLPIGAPDDFEPEQVEDVFDFEGSGEPERAEEPVEESADAPEPVAAATPHSELRSVVEDLAVVSLHIAAVETSADINRELNIKSAGAADARQQVDEIHMWENALKNKSLAIRRQAARRLKQLTGHDYDYE